MKNLLTILILTVMVFCLTVYGFAQSGDNHGHHGTSAPPKIVHFRDFPHYTPNPDEPIHEENEVETPYSPVVPPIDISQLKNVTIDKSSLSGGSPSPTAPSTSGVNFEGITQGGYIPSEPTVAAGPLNIFTMGNSSVTITNKDGSDRVEINGLTFFGAPSSEGGISDGVCMYDARRGHFIAVCFTTDAATFSHVYVAISQTNDARGYWYQYVYDWTKDGVASTTNFCDYEEIGLSDDKFAISSQQFSFSGLTYQYQKLRVWDISQIESGTGTSFTDFFNYQTTKRFVTKPGRNLGNTIDSTLYLLSVPNSGGTTLYYGYVTGTAASPVMNWTGGGTAITVTTYATVTNPPNMGSIAAFDDRTFNFVVRNHMIYEVANFSVTNGTTVDAIRLWEIDVSNKTAPVLKKDETFVSAASSGIFYYYPSVAVDSVGTVFVGFDRSSSSEFSSGWVTGERRSDANMEASAIVKQGTIASTQTRWGDYTGADMDETASGPGGAVAWEATQWAKGASVFGTWINQVVFPYNQVSGQVLLDQDGSTGTTNDRQPLSGWTATLKQGANTIGTSVTDVGGNYNFGYLENGTYDIVLTQQVGNTSALDVVTGSGGNSQTKISNLDIQVVVAMGSSVGQTSTGNNFLQANTNAAISGNVFYDINGNSARDGGEPGLSGWTVNLTGTSSASTTSDANGNYTFQNLAVGSYTVSEVIQTGYTQSEPGGGSYSISILTSTQQSANNDFGNFGKIWTGGASTTNWGDAGNWNPSGAPDNTNDIYLSSGSTIDINVAAQCKNLYIQNSADTLTVRSGNSLTVNGNLSQSNGVLNTEGSFPTVSGTTNLSGGAVGYTASSGSQTVSAMTYQTLNISGGGTKTFAGTTKIGAAMNVNGGTLNLAGDTLKLTNPLNPITVANGATMQTGGTAIYTLQKVTLGSSSTIEYSGGAETILPPTGITGGVYGNLTVSGSGTKVLTANTTVNGLLSLNQLINSSGNTLTMGASGSVTRTTGYVLGAFAKSISAVGSTTWEVGSVTDYLPISMNITSLTGSDLITQTLTNSNPATTFTGTSTKAIAHYYNIGIGAGITSITAIPTLAFTLNEFNALSGTGGDQTKLFLAEWVEGSWTSQRTNSTLGNTATGGTPGTVTLNSGVSGFSPWAIFWGTDDSPLSPPSSYSVKTWVGSGATGGGTGTDFNAAVNWSPATSPTSSDSCRIILTASATITVSSSATVGALVIGLSGTATGGKFSALNVGTNILTVIGTTTITDAGGTGTNTNQIQFSVANSPGQIVLNGPISATGAANASIVFPLAIGNSTGQVILKGNVTFGTGTFTSSTNQPATVIFDGTGTQTLNVTSASLTYWGGVTTQIGNYNNPTVVAAGTPARQFVTGNLVINGTSILDLSTIAGAFNRSFSGGSITLASGSKLRLAAASGGQTGSNFPSNFTSYSFPSGSTVEYYSTSAQTVFNTPTYSNLLITAASTKTAGNALTVAGNLTIGSGATFAGSTYTHNIGGNWSNSGTYTPSTGTVTFNGAGLQTVDNNASSFNNLTHSGAGTLQLVNNNMTLSGAMNNSAGTLDAATNSKNISVGGNWSSIGTYNPGNNTTTFTAGSGTQTLNNGSSSFNNLTHSGAGTLQLVTNDLTVAGNLTNSAGILDAATNNKNINLAGNWSNSGTFNAGTATMTMNGSAGQTMSGSTFNNLTINDGAGVTMLTVETVNGTLTLTSGTFSVGAHTLNLNGPTIGGTPTNLSTTSSSNLSFGGSASGVNLPSSVTALNNLTENNTNGLNLNSSPAVGGVLMLTNGIVSTGSNTLSANGTVSRTNGYVSGNLQKNVGTGSPSLTYEVGSATTYAPVDVAFASVSGAGTLKASTTNGNHPNIGTSSIDPTKTAARYWTLTNGGTAFTTYNATFHYVAADTAVGSNTSQFIVGKYDSPNWSYPAVGTKTATSTQATGMTTFSDFQVGDASSYTITASAGSNGSINPTGSVSVNSGSNQSFTFTPNTGYRVDSVQVDGVNTPDSTTGYTFSSVTANHTIRVTFTVSTYTITSSVTGGNGTIAPLGTTTVNYGGSQAYTMTPNTGYHIDSVFVDGSYIGNTSPDTVSNVTTNRTITVKYAINTYTVTSSVTGGNGTITPLGTTTVNYGGSQAYTMTPNTGYHIDSVFVDGSYIGNTSPDTVSNVTTNRTITVKYAINTYTVTSSVTGGNGTITPLGVTTVNYGGSQAYTLTPNTGYHIDSVFTDGSYIGNTSPDTVSNVTGNRTITVKYAINKYTITASAGANGNISPSGSVVVSYGDSSVFTITPSGAYHVSDVVVDGGSVGAMTSYTFHNVTANHTITASFTINGYTITASAGANGTINPSGSISINSGQDTVFHMTPNTGYHIDSVFTDGSYIGNTSPDTIKNVTANHTISVKFAINTYTVTSSVIGGNGTISPLGVTTVNYGGSQIYTLTPNTGYHIDSVFTDGNYVGNTSPDTVSNVTSNRTITVKYAINTYTITSSVTGGNGTISPLGVTTVNYGGSQAYTMTPNTGYHIDSVFTDGTYIGNTSPDTVKNVTSNRTISVKYAINTYTITSSVTGGNGTIAPLGVTTVNYGGSQAYTMTPNTGYHIDSIFTDGSYSGNTSPDTVKNVTANRTITVKYAINSYTITSSVTGGNGTISPLGVTTVNYGGSQAYTMTPNTGYHIDSVFTDGSYSGNTSPDTIKNVIANHTITVKYKINSYTITAVSGAGGTVTPAGVTTVTYGGSQTYTISPNAQYHIDSVTVDGSNVGAVVSYPFTNVSAGHTIQGYFSINTYVLTVNTTGSGSVQTVPNQASYISGTSVQLTAVPVDYTWLFNGWSGDTASTVNPITIVMTSAKTVTAHFGRDTAYLSSYRSFTLDSMANDRDNKGKLGKAVALKPVSSSFSFLMTAPTNTGLTLKFSQTSTGVVKKGTDSIASWTGAKTVVVVGADSGSVLTVSGRGMSGKPVKVSYVWAIAPKKSVKGTIGTFVYNYATLPMPNRVNAVQTTFAESTFGTTGLLIGKVYTDSLKNYGWFVTPKYTDVMKTLSDKSGIQSGTPHGFDVYTTTTKPVLKGQKTLPPTKFNDVLLGDLITLKVNIEASELGIIPAGLGELTYNDGTGNPFSGKMVSDLSTIGDSLMMGWQVDSSYVKGGKTVHVAVHHFANPALFLALDTTVAKVNEAFEGKIDTTSFADSLRFTGVKQLYTIPYLRRTIGMNAMRIEPVANVIPEVPQAYRLYQNYPNPFNPTTTIRFDLPADAIVTLRIYNILGQEVATLFNNEQMLEGSQTVHFNADNLASGVYFYRIVAQSVNDDGVTTSTFQTVKKMLLMK